MITDQSTQHTALEKLLAEGWTTAENRLTGERRPLAEMRDIITGVRGASQSFLTLTSADDQIKVPYNRANPPDFLQDRSYGSPYECGGSSGGGKPPVDWYSCYPWVLPADLHPLYATKQWITEYPAPPVDGSREAYEDACAAAGVPPMADREITGYGNRFMHCDFINDPRGVRRMQSWLARKRLEQIDADALAAARARAAAADAAFEAKIAAGEVETCAVCYRPLRPGEAMWASLGITCPEHYDDLSD